jgi:L-cystine uptake protein TcyP (sodium:dicarboxylate symporter family)
MKDMLSNPRKKKLFIAIVCAFFGMLMMPHSDQAAMSVFVFPSVMAGIAFGIAITQLFELTKAWSAAGMNKVDEAGSDGK